MIPDKKIKLILVHCSKAKHNTPHLGILSLASYINQKLPSILIKVIEDNNPYQKIIKNKPDIVGFTADTIDFEDTKKLAIRIKQVINSFLIIGGVHITACPESFNNNFDVGVIG